MKLEIRIVGYNVNREVYQAQLMSKALGLKLSGFSLEDGEKDEEGHQVLIARLEGDDAQVKNFKDYIKSEKPPFASAPQATYQDYKGFIENTMDFALRMQIQMLGEAFEMLNDLKEAYDEIIETQDKLPANQEEISAELDEIATSIGQLSDHLEDILLNQEKILSKLS